MRRAASPRDAVDLSPVATLPVARRRFGAKGAGGRPRRVLDHVVVEEPLEIVVDGRPWTVVMRTPGEDFDLVRGLLLAEGLAAATSAPPRLMHCRRGDADARANRVLVARPDAHQRRPPPRRLLASSACGVCGRTTVADLAGRAPAVRSDLTIDPRWLLELPRELEERQRTFARTGGLHAAALCVVHRAKLRIIAVREDIGRHNAVDKVIGAAHAAALLPLDRGVLLVSGRAGFEIVQKARVAGIPIIAAVSAPSSLAVDLARAGGQTLVAFLRRDRLNAYCGEERLRTPTSRARAAAPAPDRARSRRSGRRGRARGAR
jgi:FdhD protein